MLFYRNFYALTVGEPFNEKRRLEIYFACEEAPDSQQRLFRAEVRNSIFPTAILKQYLKG